MLTLRYRLPWQSGSQWVLIDAHEYRLNNGPPQHILALTLISPLVMVLHSVARPVRPTLNGPPLRLQNNHKPTPTMLWLWRLGFAPAQWAALRQLMLQRRR